MIEKNCYKTDLFKTSIFSSKLNLNLNELNNYCINYEKNNKGRRISNLTGFQSEDLVNDSEILKYLVDEILNLINYVGKKYYKFKNNLALSNIWFNINRFKDSNKVHSHYPSLLSGVFYSKIPKNSGNLTFNVDDLNYHLMNLNLSEKNVYNSYDYSLPPEEGFLHIFPSWLKHEVGPNLSQEERISFSFNTFNLK